MLPGAPHGARRPRRKRAVGAGRQRADELSGKGELVFAVNDDLFDDNTGGFMVTVSTINPACRARAGQAGATGTTSTTSIAGRQGSP